MRIRTDKAHAFLVVCLTLVSLGGCARRPPPTESFITKDSAGIRVTESSRPSWPEDRGWKLTPEALLEIGQGSEDPDHQFHEIIGATRLPDGTVAVVDRGSKQLRVFDDGGELVAAAGGEGEGPGEFRYIWSMTRTQGDSLLVMDERAVEVFSRAGEYLGSDPVEMPSDLLQQPRVRVDPLAVLPNGSILAWVFEAPGTRKRPVDEPFRPSVGWGLYFPDGVGATFLGWYPGPLLERIEIGSETVQFGLPFSSYAVVAAGGTPLRVAVGDPLTCDVRVFDQAGHLTRISRWRGNPPRAVEDAWVQAWKDAPRYREGTPRARAQAEAAFPRLDFPDHLPCLQAVAVDATGDLWIQKPPAPPDSTVTYVVLDPHGRWLGSVEVPKGLVHTIDVPVDIGADYFLGIWQDELGVQSVRSYGLLKPEAS